MQFSVYQESRIGARRINQDRMGYIYTRDAVLLLLADGMGGHVRGEMAAAIAMQTISKLFRAMALPSIKRPERFLEDCFFTAHRDILRYAETQHLSETPRTTIVACLIQNNTAYWAHCGDSRLYWMRNGQILARTLDHSRVASLVAQGKLSSADVNLHPDRNKLYNCLGSVNPPIVEMSRPVTLQMGDVLLLCSDGLWSVVPDHILARTLQENTVVGAVPDLLNMAISIAGPKSDNATALAFVWLGENDLRGAATISTDTLQIGETTSMVHSTQPPDDPEETSAIDEHEIERAIAEIRGAIQKTSRLTSKE